MSAIVMLVRKKPPYAASAACNRGFVCLYFLVLFLLCVTLLMLILNQQQDAIRTALNIQRTNELVSVEAAVLSYVKCEAENERLEEGSYEENGASFTLSKSNHGINASIHSPVNELLQISLTRDNTHVYDYTVVRNETAA